MINHGIGRRLATDNMARTIFCESINYGIYLGFQVLDATLIFINRARADWTFNGFRNANFPISRWQQSMHYAFLVDEITEFRRGEPFGGGVSSATLSNWIFNYNHRFGSLNNQFLSVRDRQIPRELFSQTLCRVSIEQGRTPGHQLRDIDAEGSAFDLMRSEHHNTAWQRFWGNHGHSTIVEDRRNISPIFKIEDTSVFSGYAVNVANDLLIHYNDVATIRQFNATANANDETTFLFRFAQTEYFARAATVSRGDNIWFWQNHEGEAYIARATAFFDFDIISLTFNHQGELTVIPVVSSPQDIIPEITPPGDMPSPSLSLWERLLNWLADLLGISREELIMYLIIAGAILAVLIVGVAIFGALKKKGE